MRRITSAVAEEFLRLGLPVPAADDWINNDLPLPRDFRDAAHPTGTTRMGRDPASSVVDEHCLVHGSANLYVAGSSVFPTSSHANPTQMIVAMAIRLADDVRQAARRHMNIRKSFSTSV